MNPYLVAMEHARAVSSTVRPTVLSARVGIWTLLSSVHVGNLTADDVDAAVAAWTDWGTKFQLYGRINDDTLPIKALRRSIVVLVLSTPTSTLTSTSLLQPLLLISLSLAALRILVSDCDSDGDGTVAFLISNGDEKASVLAVKNKHVAVKAIAAKKLWGREEL